MASAAGDIIARLLEQRSRFLPFVQRRVGSRATAEDILQSAFLKALERGEPGPIE